MNTRQMDTTARVAGGIVGAVAGTFLAIVIQMQLEIGFGYFYLAGLIAGAGAGSAIAGSLVLRFLGRIKLGPGAFVAAPGWKSVSTSDALKLTKGDGSLLITVLRGEADSTPATILKKYGEEAGLELRDDATPVRLTGEAVGMEAGERRSYTAHIDGKMFEGDVSAFVLGGRAWCSTARRPQAITRSSRTKSAARSRASSGSRPLSDNRGAGDAPRRLGLQVASGQVDDVLRAGRRHCDTKSAPPHRRRQGSQAHGGDHARGPILM